MHNPIAIVLWALGGGCIGLLLGWWQSRSINKLEKQPPEKIMGRVYLQSLPRILLVAALLFFAMTQDLWFGIVFAIGFTISRWIWTWTAMRKTKRKDSEWNR